MKATLRAKIVEVGRKATFHGSSNMDCTNLVQLKIISQSGKVETNAHNAQTVCLDGSLFLRELIADQIKIGAVITIQITDEDTTQTLVASS